MAGSLPAGTVTFLFTDIEGSALLAQQLPDTIQGLLTRHQAILRQAIEAHGGIVFQVVGDAVSAAFHTTQDAIKAALDAQLALENENWAPAPVRVRMGIHTGTAHPVSDKPGSLNFTGYMTLTRTQRVMAAAHGGQILLSHASAELARQEMGASISLRDLGEHRLKSLREPERIWQVLAPGLPDEFEPPHSLSAVPNNLPAPLSSFIGREREIAQVRRLLQTHRLVSLTGPGGTGKTRLSLQVGMQALDRFKDGVWFVELAPLSDPALVSNTVGSVLRVRAEQSRPLADSLLDWMRGKELLLILDNCEHLVEACARFVKDMLDASRSSRALITSREPLDLPGEQIYNVPVLECPPPDQAARIPVEELVQYPAVRLFAERARESVADFEIAPPNAAAVVQICHQLDGIPLALELAAARVRVLHVEQIVERLHDRFRLLTGGARATLPHHQTLRSLIDWSHALLTGPEQVLFRRLAVFSGGRTLEAAERVCAGEGLEASDVLELLGRLVDKSLLTVDEGPRQARYRMHQSIRQYARERLEEAGEMPELRRRHLAYFVELAEQAEPMLRGRDQAAWFDRLEAERGNLRSALEWSRVSSRPEPGLRLAGAISHFWDLHGYWSEGYDTLRSLLNEAGRAESLVDARALTGAGTLAHRCGYSGEMNELFEAALRILRASSEPGQHLLGLALSEYAVALIDRDLGRAEALAEEGIQVGRAAGDPVGLAGCLFARGMAARRRADFATARSAHEEAMRLYRDMGDEQMRALLLSNLGWTNYHAGSLAQARECFDESIRVSRQIGDRYVEANSLPGRGDLARRLGSYVEAANLLHRSLAYHREIGGAHQGLVMDLMYLGLLELSAGNREAASRYLREGVAAASKGHLHFWLRWLFDALGYLDSGPRPLRAARLFGAAEGLRARLGTQLYPLERDEYAEYTRAAKAQVDEASWSAAWDEGRQMSLEQAVELALWPA